MTNSKDRRAVKSERLALRLTSDQDQIVRSAAEARGESISEYVVRHAIEAAEADLADRRVFVVDDAAWVELQARLSAPPTFKPKLSKLMHNPSVFEE